MFKAIKKALFFLLAMPVVLRAAWRVNRIYRKFPLDQVPAKLRAVPPWRFSYFNHPGYLNGTVGKLLCCMPPFKMGPCLKRSLYLLDLWSRCGLKPTLTLGVSQTDGPHRFHAWLHQDPSEPPALQGYEILWNQ